MRSEQGEKGDGLTREIQKRVAGTAFRWMKQECATDFQFLSTFSGIGVKRFLAWIRTIEKSQQLAAALSVTCRKLRLRHIKCRATPNLELWNERCRRFPLNADLDFDWRPNGHTKQIAALVRSRLAPLRVLGPQSFELSDDNPLAVPQIRTGLVLSTELADIVLGQSLGSGLRKFEVSYVSLLGVGGTGWKIHKAEDCEGVIAQLPEVIAKAAEVIAVE
jgi:hypothetical protein